jgi:alkylated DNA nucleotide flippase Atl1
MDLKDLVNELRKEGQEWRWHATEVMARVPPGFLASYGEIARITNERYGHQINARNVAWLRRHLYEISKRTATIPLHRIARKGDLHCEYDSKRTREESLVLRGKEGTLKNPRWWHG